MRFETPDGTTYAATFDHEHVSRTIAGRTRWRTVSARTNCTLTAVAPSGAAETISEAAYCSGSDQFDRKKGEALALRRALAGLGVPKHAYPFAFCSLAARHRVRRLHGANARTLEAARSILLGLGKEAEMLRVFVAALQLDDIEQEHAGLEGFIATLRENIHLKENR